MNHGSQQLTSLHFLLEEAGKEPMIEDLVVLAGLLLGQKMEAGVGSPQSNEEPGSN